MPVIPPTAATFVTLFIVAAACGAIVYRARSTLQE
jgi:hypothetical protein